MANTDLTFARLREANVARCEGAFHPIEAWSPTDWATAVAGEVGEACNLIKKLRRLDRLESGWVSIEDSQNESRARSAYTDEIADELADAVTYIDLLAERLGIDLGEAIVFKFNEVSDRVGSEVIL